MLSIPIQNNLDDCGSNSSDGTPGKGNNSRWSTLSWDIPIDLLSPPTPDPSSTFHLDSDSRPSSGTFTYKGHKPWKTGVKLNINYTRICNLCILALCDLDLSVFHIPYLTLLQNFYSRSLLPVSTSSHIPVPDKPVQVHQIQRNPPETPYKYHNNLFKYICCF